MNVSRADYERIRARQQGTAAPVGPTIILDLFIPGIPKAQPRPRAFARRIGNKFMARVYDAGTAEAWKSCIAIVVNPVKPVSPVEGPVRLTIDFFLPRPDRLCRKKDPPAAILHTGKPDRDNLEKAVCDALTQIGVWKDDGQVCSGEVRKFYHAIGNRPGAQVRIESL